MRTLLKKYSKLRMIFILSLITLLFSCGNISDPYGYDIDEPYDFPLKPGMPEWANLKSHDEKVAALQIPHDILTRMTTRALVETCLNYPLFVEIIASTNPKIAMDRYFNGFPELLKRKDAYIYLGRKFILFDPLINEEWSVLKKGEHIFDLIEIEFLLAQDIVLESASYEDKKYLLKEALLKYEKMLTQKEYYGWWEYEKIFFLMGKILQNSGNPDISSLVINNKEISKFLERGNLYDDVREYVIDEILSIVNKVLWKKK